MQVLRPVFTVLGWLLGALLLLATVLYLFGPYEKAELSTSFDESALAAGIGPYFAAQEARFDDITPGVAKQVIWHGKAEAKTDWVVLYIHGFSATSQEIRPVPDHVARALGANLILTRLAGHGRSGQALAGVTVADWMHDVAEGLTAARQVGDRILILSLSTGGTLAAAAAMDPALAEGVEGIVFGSPNFGINSPVAPILTWPAARYWAPVLAGAERSFAPHNDGQARYWTTRYPSVAVLPLAALVKKVIALDFSQADVPALFLFSMEDTVVRPDRTLDVAARWGGATKVVTPKLSADDDPAHHILAGDIMSPGQTDLTVDTILDWIKAL